MIRSIPLSFLAENFCYYLDRTWGSSKKSTFEADAQVDRLSI